MNMFARAYHNDLVNFYRFIVPDSKSILILKQDSPNKKSDYYILENTFSYLNDVQSYIHDLRKFCNQETRVVVIYYNFLWRPILALASILKLRRKDTKEPNWLSSDDIFNLFTLEGFDVVKQGKRLLLPVSFGIVSNIVNNLIGNLPLVNNFCLTSYQVFRLKPLSKDYSVSIVIPARNEAGHIQGILEKIPVIGTKSEVIFVEGHSNDNTYQVIEQEIKTNKTKHKVYVFKQEGKGKGDAVRLGFDRAQNDILMILDADLTTPPEDLVKFYRALSERHCEFANGTRLVYQMQNQAMRNLNYLGNHFFSWVFSYVLGQKIRDTLCGTKVLFRTDYQLIAKNRKFFGDFDPFGDFDLLFGAAKLNLKIMDIPIRYRARTYGTTNISRFTHGVLLLKMTLFAAKKLKFV